MVLIISYQVGCSGFRVLVLCVCGYSFSKFMSNSVTPWTVACQAPLSLLLPRQEYWSGLPFPSPGHLPDQGSNLSLLHGRWILYTEPWGKPLGSLSSANSVVFFSWPRLNQVPGLLGAPLPPPQQIVFSYRRYIINILISQARAGEFWT